MTSETPEKSTLEFGQYTIEFTNGPSLVYRIDNEGRREWIASCPDPKIAMNVVEGMVLVENKRFYHPESEPVINFNEAGTAERKPVPPFLRRKRS